MALNPNYEQIGKSFVQQYYALMDDSAQRPNVANFYSVGVTGPRFHSTTDLSARHVFNSTQN